MGVDDFRVLVTVLAFVAFVGIVVWAYSRKRKHDFERAAALPFADEAGDDRDSDAGKGAAR